MPECELKNFLNVTTCYTLIIILHITLFKGVKFEFLLLIKKKLLN